MCPNAEQFDPKERILKQVMGGIMRLVMAAEQFDPKERILKHKHNINDQPNPLLSNSIRKSGY